MALNLRLAEGTITKLKIPLQRTTTRTVSETADVLLDSWTHRHLGLGKNVEEQQQNSVLWNLLILMSSRLLLMSTTSNFKKSF